MSGMHKSYYFWFMIYDVSTEFLCRCIAVTQPLRYARHRNSSRVLVMLAMTWIVSVVISSPIVFGMNYTDRRAETPWLCIFYNSDFIIYSSMGSFYIPCIVMLVLYWRIFRAIRRRARRQRRASLQRRKQLFPADGNRFAPEEMAVSAVDDDDDRTPTDLPSDVPAASTASVTAAGTVAGSAAGTVAGAAAETAAGTAAGTEAGTAAWTTAGTTAEAMVTTGAVTRVTAGALTGVTAGAMAGVTAGAAVGLTAGAMTVVTAGAAAGTTSSAVVGLNATLCQNRGHVIHTTVHIASTSNFARGPPRENDSPTMMTNATPGTSTTTTMSGTNSMPKKTRPILFLPQTYPTPEEMPRRYEIDVDDAARKKRLRRNGHLSAETSSTAAAAEQTIVVVVGSPNGRSSKGVALRTMLTRRRQRSRVPQLCKPPLATNTLTLGDDEHQLKPVQNIRPSKFKFHLRPRPAVTSVATGVRPSRTSRTSNHRERKVTKTLAVVLGELLLLWCLMSYSCCGSW